MSASAPRAHHGRTPRRGGATLSRVALPIAAATATAVALGAWHARALTRRGAAAAAAVGTAVLAGTGWEGGAVLAAFFVSSSAVSRLVRPRADQVIDAKIDAKGDCRDASQVAANGGVALLGGLLAFAERGPIGRRLGYHVLTGSLAAAAADTWATTAGAHSRIAPRNLLTGREVVTGTSGGVTLLGSAGALVGAGSVALTAAVAVGRPALFPLATLIGFAGMIADSILGGSLQGRFHCPRCDRSSEWRRHRCGTATIHRGGLPWLDNDRVNLSATALAAGLSLAAWRRAS